MIRTDIKNKPQYQELLIHDEKAVIIYGTMPSIHATRAEIRNAAIFDSGRSDSITVSLDYPRVAISSASATTLPSTSAWPAAFTTFDRNFRICTSNTS